MYVPRAIHNARRKQCLYKFVRSGNCFRLKIQTRSRHETNMQRNGTAAGIAVNSTCEDTFQAAAITIESLS